MDRKDRVRLRVLDRYGHACVACGRSDVPLTMDHKVDQADGGRWTVDNLRPMCFDCHEVKTKFTNRLRQMSRELDRMRRELSKLWR